MLGLHFLISCKTPVTLIENKDCVRQFQKYPGYFVAVKSRGNVIIRIPLEVILPNEYYIQGVKDCQRDKI